jgi:tetratricopeptide (TPR) repeat protein
MVYFTQRHYAEALAQWRKVASLHPDLLVIRGFIGMALEANGDAAGAMAEYTANAARFPNDSELRIVHLLASTGHHEEASRRLEALQRDRKDDPFTSAAIYAALGDKDKAFASLEMAWQRGDRWMLKVHPFLDPLRGDPRYLEFLRRAGL